MRAVTAMTWAWVGAAALLPGCGADTGPARALERQGRYAEAYDSYLLAVEAGSRSGSAARGLRRTAPKAAEYWANQARAADQAGDWQQAGRCHLEVLQIKPDQSGSIAALRRIEREHPEELALLGREGRWTALHVKEQPSPAAPGPGRIQVVAAHDAPRPEPVEARAERPPQRPAHPEPAVPVRSGTGVAAAQPPRPQPPTVRSDPSDAAGEFIVLVRISEDDQRYPRTARLAEGLSLRLKDTHDDPDTADVEILLGDKRIGRFKKLMVNSVISATALTGRRFEIVVKQVNDADETVTIALREAR